MKKIFNFAAVLFAILAIGVVMEKIAFTRVTSSAIDRDIWCGGKSGAEVCVDSSGNLIPTTDDDADLGTSALQWKDGYFDGTVYADVISNDGAYTGTSIAATSFIQPASKTLAELALITPTAVGQMYYCSDCAGDTVSNSVRMVVSTAASGLHSFSIITATNTYPE